MRQPAEAVIAKGSAEYCCSSWAPVPGDPRNALCLDYRRSYVVWQRLWAIETGQDQNLDHQECRLRGFELGVLTTKSAL